MLSGSRRVKGDGRRGVNLEDMWWRVRYQVHGVRMRGGMDLRRGKLDDCTNLELVWALLLNLGGLVSSTPKTPLKKCSALPMCYSEP